MSIDDRARCDGCWQVVPVWELSLVMVQVCQQTHSSPAEYEERRVCESCRTDDRDEAYGKGELALARDAWGRVVNDDVQIVVAMALHDLRPIVMALPPRLFDVRQMHTP